MTERAIEADFRRNAAEYGHSEPLFRMVTLVRALQRHCRVVYNPAKVGAGPGDPVEADDQFVHGAVVGPGGTCASLPVVYAAVGRRIGYPVRLVLAHGHVFCRWDDPASGARVNVEGTRHDGVNCHPDDHYRAWPAPLDPRAEAVFGYLRSLSPRGELASFLGHRRAVWEQAGEYLQAVDAAAGAAAAEPGCRGHALQVLRLVRAWGDRLRNAGRIGGGFRFPARPVGPRRWPDLAWPVEAEILWLDAAGRGTMPAWAFGWDDSGRKANADS